MTCIYCFLWATCICWGSTIVNLWLGSG